MLCCDVYEGRQGEHTRDAFLYITLAHPCDTFFRPSCVQKPPGGLTNESEVSSPVTDVSVRIVVLGVLRRTVLSFGPKKLGSSAGASALQASGRHRTTLVRDAHGPRQRTPADVMSMSMWM